MAWTGFIRTWGLNADAVRAATYQFRYSVSGYDPYVPEGPYQSFALFHVLLVKEELAVEVREVDSIKVQESDISKPGHHYVLY